MKYLLLTTVEAVMLVGWGNPEANHAQLDATKEGNTKALDISIHAAATIY